MMDSMSESVLYPTTTRPYLARSMVPSSRIGCSPTNGTRTAGSTADTARMSPGSATAGPVTFLASSRGQTTGAGCVAFRLLVSSSNLYGSGARMIPPDPDVVQPAHIIARSKAHRHQADFMTNPPKAKGGVDQPASFAALQEMSADSASDLHERRVKPGISR